MTELVERSSDQLSDRFFEKYQTKVAEKETAVFQQLNQELERIKNGGEILLPSVQYVRSVQKNTEGERIIPEKGQSLRTDAATLSVNKVLDAVIQDPDTAQAVKIKDPREAGKLTEDGFVEDLNPEVQKARFAEFELNKSGTSQKRLVPDSPRKPHPRKKRSKSMASKSRNQLKIQNEKSGDGTWPYTYMDEYVPKLLIQKWDKVRKDFIVVYFYWKGLHEDLADDGFINYLQEQCPEFLNTLKKECMNVARKEDISIKDHAKFKELKDRIWGIYGIETDEQKAERKRKLRSERKYYVILRNGFNVLLDEFSLMEECWRSVKSGKIDVYVEGSVETQGSDGGRNEDDQEFEDRDEAGGSNVRVHGSRPLSPLVDSDFEYDPENDERVIMGMMIRVSNEEGNDKGETNVEEDSDEGEDDSEDEDVVCDVDMFDEARIYDDESGETYPIFNSVVIFSPVFKVGMVLGTKDEFRKAV
ncbi:hypothetical protein ACS0TY_027857 [Phlomoides rotata]